MLYAPLGPVRFDRVPSVCTARVANVDDADEEDDLEDADIVSHHWDDPTTPTGSKDNGQFDVQQQQLASSNRKAATKIIEYSSFSAKTLRQIEMDLPRTHPHIPIFHVPQVRNPMRRILYIFGMLNPHKSYVQGMNEILSAILVVFLAERIPETECHDEHASAVGHQGMGKETEPLLLTEEQVRASQMSNNPILSFLKRRDFSNVCSSAKQLVDAEADAYWVYSELIARVDDNFCGDQAGILRRVNQMDMLVSKVDPTLSMHLRHNGNDFLQFGFRWINCLLMRELPLHLVVKYWDALLAHQRGIADFHVYFCAALLTRFTDTLVTLDFEECMMFLQHLPTRMWAEDDIDELLSQATVWEQSFNIDTYG